MRPLWFRVLALGIHLGAMLVFAYANEVAGPLGTIGFPYLLLAISGTYLSGRLGIIPLVLLPTYLLASAELTPIAGLVVSTVLRLGVFGVVTVLTDLLVRRTAALEHQSAELRREMALRKEYTAVVMHELRNPLVGIRNAAGILPQHPDPARLTEGIRDEATAALNLLDALSEVESMEARRLNSVLEPIDLTDVVRSATEIREGDTRLRISGLDGHLAVLGDRERLAQVVKNLLSNAVKYSPPQTPIELEAGVSGDQRNAIVSVRDYGAGIPPAERSQLFRKFKRLSTSGTTRGSGLGLYICQQIVRDHGGTLEASWPPGGGTRFSFTVPIR